VSAHKRTLYPHFPLETGNTRVSDILAMAGGITPSGSDIVILAGPREGKPFRKGIDFPAIYVDYKQSDDLVVAGGGAAVGDRVRAELARHQRDGLRLHHALRADAQRIELAAAHVAHDQEAQHLLPRLAVVLAARVVHRVAQEEDFENFLLMHAMGANAAGQVASVVAGGVLLALMGAR